MNKSSNLAANKWLVAVAVIVPTVLEVLDGTVVMVSLPYIRGSLNAGVDEVAWVLTSYLVANGIVIPLQLARARAVRRGPADCAHPGRSADLYGSTTAIAPHGVS